VRTSAFRIIFFSVCVLVSANANDDLFKAAVQMNAAGVKAALAKGARVGATDQQARTALHIAAGNGSLDIIGLLLDAKAPLSTRDSDGLTPLLRAARSLQGRAVELLLQRGADKNSLISLLGVKDSAGQTLLHTAARKGSAESVSAFSALGVNSDPRDNGGRTPLSLAVSSAGVEAGANRKAFLETARILLEHGADPLRPDAKGYTPLWYAVRQDDGEFALILSEKGVDAMALAEAYDRGDLHIADILADRISDVAAVDSTGRTFLHVAAGQGLTSLAEKLLSLQADVNAADRFGRTPLALAVTRGDAEMTRVLLEGGADPNKPGEAGVTPLGLAVRLAEADVADLLITAGAEVNPRSGTPPLTAAVQARNLVLAEFLILRGADINAPDPSGNVPLQYAVETRTGIPGLEMLRLLLEQGAAVDQRNAAGETALLRAAAGGKLDEAALLLEHGADPGAPDARGRTPVSAAKESGNKKMIALLDSWTR
jgi:ankyrin repeat protein